MAINRKLQESITIQHVLDVLNEAVKADKAAIKNLIAQRVTCNKQLADHPTIQVAQNKEGNEWEVGFLGVLNGLFGAAEDGWGAIGAIYEVVCPADYNHSTGEGQKTGDKCSVCGEQLVLGDSIGFKQIRPI